MSTAKGDRVLPGGITVRELNAKYPRCRTCAFRQDKPYQVRSKTLLRAWCGLHNRDVEYETITRTNEKGKHVKWILRDVPCDDWKWIYP